MTTLSLKATLEITAEIFKRSFCVPIELEGVVARSLKELQEKCPPNGERGEIYLREHVKRKNGGKGMDIYARQSVQFPGAWDDVAYGCPGCGNIHARPPQIRIVENKEALLYLCECGMLLSNLKPEQLEY